MPLFNSIEGVRIVQRSEFINIKVPKATTINKIMFPDNQNIRWALLHGIAGYCNNNMPFLPGLLPTIPYAMADNIVMTLQMYNGDNFVSQMPYVDLINLDSSAFNTFPLIFNEQKINWPKSYIEIIDPSLVNPAIDEYIPFNIYYRKDAAKEKNAKKANFGKQS